MNNMQVRRNGSFATADVIGGMEPQFVADRQGGGTARPLIAQYISVLRRRKWIIIGAVAASLIIALIVTLLITPSYSASATIEIQRETSNFIKVEGAEQESTAVDQEFYQTQYGLLQAKSLADRVATARRLYDSQTFFEMFGAPEAETWFENGRPIATASSRDERIKEAGEILLDHFEVLPARNSRLVEIRFTSPDPSFSKQTVDAWGKNFIEMTLERRFEATSYARQFLEERLSQLRTRIDESERKLVGYAAKEGIINLPAASIPGGEGAALPERSLAVDDLATLNQELSKAKAARFLAQSRLGSRGGTVDEALDNQAITGLRGRRAELSAEYARLLVQFEPGYPAARALQTQISQLDSAITREESRVGATLRQTYDASLQREQALAAQVSQLKTGVLDLRRRSIEYNIYQRDVDTNRQLYDALLQRYKEIGVAGGVGVNNISLVDQAETPQKPSSPNLPLNMVIGLLAGAAIGVGGAFGVEQIDEGISDPSEVEETLNLPVLGTIPRVADGQPAEELNDRKSPVAEAYLSVQTSLAFSTDHGAPRTLVVTSTRPAEGKTTTSYALARSLARSSRRTLLIDADMRSPSIHHVLGMRNDAGLSNYLSGSSDVSGLIRESGHDGLFVMSAGPHPPSAAELLSSDRLGQLIDELAAHFDNVVFDAPPVMGLADAPLLASRVEGTVFVVESHGTKRSMARVAIGRLHAANAPLLGIVLTKFDAKKSQYGYGYDYGYGYGQSGSRSDEPK